MQAAAQNDHRALGSQLSVVSPHFSHQRRQHAFHLNDLCFKSPVVWLAQVVQVVSEQKLIFEFACGPNRDLEKPTHLYIAFSATAFRDIRTY